jgi:PAS domain S-box-containing protein
LLNHQAAIAALEREILELMSSAPDDVQEGLQTLHHLAGKYRDDFLELVAAYRQRGFKEWGLEGEWRRAMLEVEGYVERTQNVFAVRSLLDLMRDEKAYLLQNEARYSRAIYEDLKELRRMVLAQNVPASPMILKALEDYETAFTQFVWLEQTIGITDDVGLQGELQRSSQAMEPILRSIHQRAIQAGERAREAFLEVISMIWAIGLGLGGTIFYFHAKSIAQPIVQLKDAALKIGQGHFDINLAIASTDEVGVLAKAFNQMVTDLGRTEQALRESEEHSRLVIETANDAFIGMDQDGLITDWNRQAEVIFGWSGQEVIGRGLGETLIPARYRASHASGLQRFLATGIGPMLSRRVELSALHRDGREFPVELTVWPIHTGNTCRFNAFIHDITERKETEEVIRQSEQRFRTLTTHAPVGIYLTDPQGDCLFVNDRWCKMAGMPLEEAQGQGWLNAIHSEDREHVFDEWQTTARAGREFAREYRFQTPQGKTTWLHGTAVALRNEQGDITGYLGTVTDITERKQADQMKSDFVSFVTHQLRTPLAGIKWLLELASEERALPEETLSFIQDARVSADRLVKLVNDLLDISRLERGKLKILPKAVALDELTRSVLADVQPLIQEKGHRLSFTDASGLPPVQVDQQLMRQVILNLASNAIKYTPAGGEIAVTVRQEGRQLCWAIQDSGIGVPAAAQSRLFEKFYRAENGLTMETEGTGLGLYLVRLILEQFEGRVWCESEEGKGAIFLFTLPLPECNQ